MDQGAERRDGGSKERMEEERKTEREGKSSENKRQGEGRTKRRYWSGLIPVLLTVGACVCVCVCVCARACVYYNTEATAVLHERLADV